MEVNVMINDDHNADVLQGALHILQLPQDCQWLIMDKLDFGNLDHRTDLWAVSGSCKSLKRLLAQFPAHIRYRGAWNQMQLEGLCKGLPCMNSFQPARNEAGLPMHTTPQLKKDALSLRPFLRCPSLQTLDLQGFRHSLGNLGDLKNSARILAALEAGLHLPQGLAELRIPGKVVPRTLRWQIDALPKLKRLDCQKSGYYPSSKLTTLEYLAVGGSCSTPSDEDAMPFFKYLLQWLSRLTSLDVIMPCQWQSLSPTIFASLVSLRELTMLVYEDVASTKPVMSLLAPLTGLHTLNLHCHLDGAAAYRDKLPPLPSAGTLRSLEVQGLPVDLEGLNPARMTSLVYWSQNFAGPTGSYVKLSSWHVEVISQLTGLKRLGLCKWREWPDLSPLAHLQVEALECSDVSMLADLLQPGWLQQVRSVRFPRHWALLNQARLRVSPNAATGGLVRPWGSEAARLATALHMLPHLESLGICTDSAPWTEAELQYQETLVGKIVVLYPEDWRRSTKESGQILFLRVEK